MPTPKDLQAALELSSKTNPSSAFINDFTKNDLYFLGVYELVTDPIDPTDQQNYSPEKIYLTKQPDGMLTYEILTPKRNLFKGALDITIDPNATLSQFLLEEEDFSLTRRIREGIEKALKPAQKTVHSEQEVQDRLLQHFKDINTLSEIQNMMTANNQTDVNGLLNNAVLENSFFDAYNRATPSSPHYSFSLKDPKDLKENVIYLKKTDATIDYTLKTTNNPVSQGSIALTQLSPTVLHDYTLTLIGQLPKNQNLKPDFIYLKKENDQLLYKATNNSIILEGGVPLNELFEDGILVVGSPPAPTPATEDDDAVIEPQPEAPIPQVLTQAHLEHADIRASILEALHARHPDFKIYKPFLSESEPLTKEHLSNLFFKQNILKELRNQGHIPHNHAQQAAYILQELRTDSTNPQLQKQFLNILKAGITNLENSTKTLLDTLTDKESLKATLNQNNIPNTKYLQLLSESDVPTPPPSQKPIVLSKPTPPAALKPVSGDPREKKLRTKPK